jgi:MoaA/NifB/PqqE/SkfB family radical SAM enzyme
VPRPKPEKKPRTLRLVPAQTSGETTDATPSRRGAEEFPLMIVISTVYPCNLGCPSCPYTDENSPIRKFYRENKGDYFPVELWDRIAREAGPYQAWLRCTGGGEPMMHPQMVEMIETAKARGARVWLNTNGTRFGPQPPLREKLRRVIAAGIDLIEFSMDAGDAESYALLRPPLSRAPVDPQQRWQDQVGNVREALRLRKELRQTTRIVVSIIRQAAIEGKLDAAVRFWTDEVGVDDVITRKFLTWDDNTSISTGKALDRELYRDLGARKKDPCVWPFERLNIDTLGRIALCGQDISFRTSVQFPNAWDQSIRDIWQGEVFNRYRRLHLAGDGETVSPCGGCSAWFAGIRDWKHGWLKVLRKSGDHLRDVMKRDLGVDVQVYEPAAVKDVVAQAEAPPPDAPRVKRRARR